MNDGYSEEVEEWLRDFTTVEWSPTYATHCMSYRYQRLDPRSWPFPGVPAFPPDSVEGVQPEDETASPKESGRSKPTLRDDHDKMVHFIVETRRQFRGLTSEGAEGACLLRDEIGRLEEDTERLASIIDEKFKVVRERPEEELRELREKVKEYPHLAGVLDTSKQIETDIVRETRRLKRLLDNKTKDGASDDFEDIFDSRIEIEDRSWRLTHEQSSSAHLVSERPKRDGYDVLSPLATPGIKSCVSLSSAGYEAGLDYFPADATVLQARTYFNHYLTDLRRAADKLGNTHALLYLRLLMAEMVHHEQMQYRRVEEWSPGMIKGEWVDRDFSSSRVKNPQGLMSAMEELLAKPPDEGKDVWRKVGESWMPNAAGLYWHLKKRKRKLIRREPDARSSNAYITPQSLRKYVGYFTKAKLVKLRSHAGLDPQ
jgi:hypothetical protein